MNSLEFIEKEIELTKDVIENTQETLSNDAPLEIRMYCYFNKEAVLDRLNYAKDRLQTLLKIKFELEVWEIAKAKEIDLYDVITSQDVEEFNMDLYKDYQLTEEEFNKLKKALEVEE